jgi:cholesterol transport system auxiliary component
MMKKTILLALMASVGGCVSFGAKPPPSLLTISADTMAPANAGKQIGSREAITVTAPIVPQAIATTRVPVTKGGTEIAYVKNAVWIETPARMFQRLISETIAAKTGRVVLDPRQFALAPGTQLTGSLREFGIDADANEAVVVYDGALSNDKGLSIQTRRFEARVPVSEIKALSVGRALNDAANKVAAEVAAWVAG